MGRENPHHTDLPAGRCDVCCVIFQTPIFQEVNSTASLMLRWLCTVRKVRAKAPAWRASQGEEENIGIAWPCSESSSRKWKVKLSRFWNQFGANKGKSSSLGSWRLKVSVEMFWRTKHDIQQKNIFQRSTKKMFKTYYISQKETIHAGRKRINKEMTEIRSHCSHSNIWQLVKLSSYRCCCVPSESRPWQVLAASWLGFLGSRSPQLPARCNIAMAAAPRALRKW